MENILQSKFIRNKETKEIYKLYHDKNGHFIRNIDDSKEENPYVSHGVTPQEIREKYEKVEVKAAMGYEINVSLNGSHFFATAERSLVTIASFEKVLKVFKDKFPKEEGYEISAIRWEKAGKILDIEE